MLSELTEAMIVNGVVLATVLATDLGPARKIGPARLLRPGDRRRRDHSAVCYRPVTTATALSFESPASWPALGGLAAVALMGVYRSPETGKPVSRAGWPTRSSGPSSSAPGRRSPTVRRTGSPADRQLGIANQVSEAAITDGLIFMAVVMVLVRTAGFGSAHPGCPPPRRSLRRVPSQARRPGPWPSRATAPAAANPAATPPSRRPGGVAPRARACGKRSGARPGLAGIG